MLEITRETMWKIDPLLDAGDVEQAGKLLFDVDSTSLRALFIHIVHERGAAVAERLGKVYLRERDARSAMHA